MAIILLIRHGENDWVKEHRLAGWTPGVHLNEHGHTQARQLAARLAHLPIAAIYSSPLERCRETAEHLAATHSLPVGMLPEVGEVHYGDWQGAKIKALAAKPEWFTIQHYPGRFEFPRGESLRGVQARAVDALEQLARGADDDALLAVVSHADVIKLVLAHYLGVHIDLFQRIGLSPASVSVVALPQRGGVSVLRVNDDGPLQPPPKAADAPADTTPTDGPTIDDPKDPA